MPCRHAPTSTRVIRSNPKNFNACGHDLQWDAPTLSVLRDAGLDCSTLPHLADVGGLQASVSGLALDRWPELEGASIRLGVGDGAAACLGSGCVGTVWFCECTSPGKCRVTVGRYRADDKARPCRTYFSGIARLYGMGGWGYRYDIGWWMQRRTVLRCSVPLFCRTTPARTWNR